MQNIIGLLNESYPIRFDRLELLRDMGSAAYVAFSGSDRYFLRVIKPAFHDTAIDGANIQAFLQTQGVPVPPIIPTHTAVPYAQSANQLLILYAFIEGDDCKPETDAEAIGALTGRLHQTMKAYPGTLKKRDKHFYIGRYIDILRTKQYPQIDAYIAYGDMLWDKIKSLPMAFCHGDLYDGNIRKAQDGALYLHDFDTACEGFPMYDPTLICNMTQYFHYDDRDYGRSMQVLARFLPAYQTHATLTQAEIDAFAALVALQHFSTQATVMEIVGMNCIDETVMDNQLDWLNRWAQYIK